MLLHPVNDLSNITVREVNRSLQQPYCIYVGRDIFSVAVFEWKSDGFLSFQPAVIKVATYDQPSNNNLIILRHQFPNTNIAIQLQCFQNNHAVIIFFQYLSRYSVFN